MGFNWLTYYFKCCNLDTKAIFSHKFDKPKYKYIAYYICPNCGKRWFEEIKEGKEKPEYHYGNAATKLYEKWTERLFNLKHGTKANQSFYYGTFKKQKDVWNTFRTNFNNEKEFLFKQKIKSS